MLRLGENWKYLSTAQLPGQFTAMGSSATVVGGELKIWAGSAANAYNNFSLPSPQGTIIVNLRIRPDFSGGTTDPACYLIKLIDTATVQCGLSMRTSDRKLYFWRNSDATQIGPLSTNALTDGIEYDIEAKITLGNTGTVELRVNGFVEIPPTTVDNTNTANNTCSVVTICQSQFAGMGGGLSRLLHCVIMDGSGADMNNFLGVVNVNLHTMNGAGAHTDFIRGGTDLGANYKQVNEIPPNEDTTYVGSGTVGQMDTYQFSDMPAGVTVVYALAVVFRARRDDSAARGIKPVIRTGGVDYLGAEKAMSSAYNFHTHWWSKNPGTTLAWTVPEVNAAEAGMKVTT